MNVYNCINTKMYVCIYLFNQLCHIYYLAPLFKVVWIRLIACWLFVFVFSFVHFLIHSPKTGLGLLQYSQLKWGCNNDCFQNLVWRSFQQLQNSRDVEKHNYRSLSSNMLEIITNAVMKITNCIKCKF